MEGHWLNQPIHLQDFFDAVVSLFPPPNEVQDEFISTIREMKEKMAKTYNSKLSSKEDRPDYSDHWRRCTYMYAYLPRHVHLVYSAIMRIYRMPDEESTFQALKQEPIVCSVGGGPNIDALGLSLFLSITGCSPPLVREVHVLDHFPEWRFAWENVEGKLAEEYKEWMPHTTWHNFDMLQPVDQQNVGDILQSADIITFVKSLSPVAMLDKDSLESNICGIVRRMKKGSLLLFIDNTGSPARDLIHKALSAQKPESCRIVHEGIMTAVLNREIFSEEAENLIETIEHQPVLSAGENVMMLIQKLR